MRWFALALTVCLALFAHVAPAQPGAGGKARGEFNFYGRGARSAMRGARDSTRSFQEYVRQTQPAPPQIVREVPAQVVVVSPRIVQAASDEIGDYIYKSERHMAWMRRQAEASGDKETLASLDSIDRNLAAAKQKHVALCDCCAADTIDSAAAVACCQVINESLAKAISQHDVLMKRLGADQPVEN
jgi:hypothetical protein